MSNLEDTTDRHSTEICIETIDDSGKTRALKALLDSGCSKSIVLKKFAQKTKLGKKIRYSTYGGGSTTSRRTTDLEFKLVEFSHSKRV